jgi:hypothetical protein
MDIHMHYSDLVNLTEGVRVEKMFHMTKKWLQIIDSGYMVPALLDYTEARIVTRGMGYKPKSVESKDAINKLVNEEYRFISFARTMQSSFLDEMQTHMDSHEPIVSYEFDARKVKRDYKVVPISYYGHRSQGGEQEERLITKDEEFPIWNYATGIHVYIDSFWEEYIDMGHTDDKAKALQGWIKQLMLTGRAHKIPVYVYRNLKDFRAARWTNADEISQNSDLDFDDDD